MSNASAKLLVFASGQMACIKIAGRANFTSSLDFKLLVQELNERAIQRLVLDLSECVLMDSTFLGVLAGFGLKSKLAENGHVAGQSIELMNPNPRIADLLENLGVLHLFTVMNGPCLELFSRVTTPVDIPTAQPSREEITRNCLEAHKTLMEIDPANIPKFKEVAQFLAEDLKKIRSS